MFTLLQIEMLANLLLQIAAIISAIIFLYKPLKAQLNRITKVEQWTKKQQEDIESSKANDVIILASVLTCLEGLKREGHNGEIDSEIRAIKKFLIEKSGKGSSYQSN